MTGYLRLELMRSLRDPRYLLLAVVAPVGFYLLFAALFGQYTANGVSTSVLLMVSMSVYGAMWAVLSATGPRIAQDRSVGWLRQLKLLPVQPRAVLTARLIAALLLAGPALALVFATATISHGVRLDAWHWLALLGLLWVGVVPIGALGLAIGYATDADSAFGLLYGLYMVLAALGGLWMPISILPSGLQTIGKLLPSYRAADLGWRLVAGRSIDVQSVLMLAAWAIILGLLALFFAKRRATDR